MEIGSLGRWYDAGPILTANLGDTANPSWNDLFWIILRQFSGISIPAYVVSIPSPPAAKNTFI